MQTSSDHGCFHCGLPTTVATACEGEIQGKIRKFCCSGCMTVCQVIHESGLEAFYQRLNYSEAEAPPPEAADDLEQYDLPEVQAEFVQHDGEYRQAHLLIEGIHCAACVWLIEHGLAALDGIESAEVNLAHQRLNVRWHGQRLQLSAIMQRLAMLGYAAAPFNPESVEGAIQRRNRALLFRMAFAGFGAMNIMWISIALYAGAFSGIDLEHKAFFHLVSFFIATPVLLYSGWPFMRAALLSLHQRHLTMDVPIAIGSLATWGYSCWITFASQGEVYFDTVVTFLFVILIGRYLEGLSKRNASSAALRLMELQPRMATRISGDEEQRVSVRKLVIDDLLMIRPGERLPADGVVVRGGSHVDESMLSGESRPISKQSGDAVVAGSINLDGALTMQVRALGRDTALSRIVALVEDAQGSKASVQRIADRIVPWFVATTLALALITFSYWFDESFDKALLAAVSVLIITCPCALGLATPMAIAVGVGVGAREGVLVRNGQALEQLSQITHVVFDKTGTLTEGRMRMVDITPADGMSAETLLDYAAAVELLSEHPLSTAITAACRQRPPQCESFEAVAGMGVSGVVDGASVMVGHARLLQQHGVVIDAAWQQRQQRIEQQMGVAALVAIDGRLAGIIHLQDRMRSEAAALIELLSTNGLGISILSGDSEAASRQLAQRLGDIKVVAEQLPQQKQARIRELQQRGERVLMIGDGINDAPALAQADVSMALGSGMDLSKSCADIVLISPDLLRIDFAMSLARRTLGSIRQNITISLLYNLILVPAAMAAMVTPVFAAIAMPISSLLVIGNAILIRAHMRRGRNRQADTLSPVTAG